MFSTKQNNKPSIRRSVLALLVLVMAFATSCKKEYLEFDKIKKDVTWNPELAVPLVNTTVNAGDVLDRFDDEDIVIIDPNTGLLALRYYGEIFSITAEELIQLQTQTASVPVALTPQQIADLQANGSVTVSATLPYTFQTPSGEQLATVLFKNGGLLYNLTNDLPNDATITVNINSLTQGGTSYSQTITANGNAVTNQTDSLANYLLDLTRGGTTTNAFDISFSITFQRNNSQVPLPTQTLNIETGIQNPRFRQLTGDIGQQSVTTGFDSVRIRIFENSTDGTIQWRDPIVRTFWFNSYGCELEINLNTFIARTPTGDIPITGFTNPIIVGADLLNVGTQVLTIDSIPNGVDPSNIDVIASSNPSSFFYDIATGTNPGTGPFNNWVIDTSRLRLDMEVELPFDGRAQDFTQQDTIQLDIFPLDDDVEEIVSVTFRLNMNNGFPIDGYGQAYFADSNNVIVDSLLADPDEALIESGVLTGSRVTQATSKITDITMDRAKLERLEAANVSRIITKARASTTGGGNTDVQIYSDYILGLKLGMMVEAVVKVRVN